MESLDKLDPNQQFSEIQIESEHENITLKHVNLNQSMEKLMDIVHQMDESKFYKNVKVYFGTKTKQPINYLQQHYRRQLQYLNLSLEEEKEYLQGIVNSKSEQELKLRQLTHKQNQLVIMKRVETVKQQGYIPCIYVKSEKKGPIFGQIQQDINKHGAGTLSARLGYRSPFVKYDHLQFNLQWPLQTKLNKRYYQLGLSWNNPLKKIGDFFVRLNSGNDPTYENIDTHCNGISMGLAKGPENYELQWSYRIPFIHRNVANQIKAGFYHPSSKLSLKYSRILQNSITANAVYEGQFSQVKAELGLPLVGESNFIRLQYCFRKFYDTYGLRRKIDNDWLRKFFWKSTVETNFSAATITQYGRKHFINDALEPVDVRGFHNYKRPQASYANIRGALKFNIHNYPVISDVNIAYFLYSQCGLSFLKKESPLRPFWLGSTGIGFSFNFGPAQLQLLCNLMQYQNKQLREPTGFQFRFSIND